MQDKTSNAIDPLVSINIVTFNAKRYIEKCLESIANQTYKTLEVGILDNNSEDNTRELIAEALKTFSLKAKTYKLKTNMGFAKGQNILIQKSRGEYILMLNQDAWIDENYVKNALDVFQKNDKIAALQPKIYRYTAEKESVVKSEGKPIIDATGLIMLKNRRIIARGQGQKDEGQFDKEESIFGVDGAAPIFRRMALEDTKLSKNSKLKTENSEYLDEDFFMYKEDVDISWRLRLYGWEIHYSPKVIAYHERGSGDSAATNYVSILKERKHIGTLAKSLSWHNQRLMQVKNELLPLYIIHFPRIIVKEIASLIYILLFERYALQSIKAFFFLAPKAWRKRREIMAKRKAGYREMKQWFQ